MRSMIIIVAICLVLSLGLGVFCSLYTRKLSDDYQQQMDAITSALNAGQWKTALDRTRNMEEKWENHARILSLFTDHAQVDAVSFSLTQLRVYIEEMEKYHALLYVAEFCESLALIDSRDAFVLKNIL